MKKTITKNKKKKKIKNRNENKIVYILGEIEKIFVC